MEYIEEKKAETGLKRLSEATDIDKLLDQLHSQVDAMLNKDQSLSSSKSLITKVNQSNNSKVK
jgi:hypothetical protein